MKIEERKKARDMRSRGCSVKEITDALGVAKSSVSVWVRDIELTSEQKSALSDRCYQWGAKNKGAQTNKRVAAEARDRWRNKGYEIAVEDIDFRVICALYWGEGAKVTPGTASISNSDAGLLRLWGKWIISMGYLNRMNFRVQYYSENGISEEQIWEKWKNDLDFILDEHRRKFTKCVINRASQRKKIGSLPYGTANLSVYSVELLANIFGGIDYLRAYGLR